MVNKIEIYPNHIAFVFIVTLMEFMNWLHPKEEAMTDGDYKLYFLSKASGEKEWQLDENWDKVYVQIKLDDAHSKMTTKLVNNTPKLELKTISFSKETIKVGEPVTITLSITNKGKGDFHGDLLFQEKGEKKPLAAGIAADVPAGETRDIKMYWNPRKAGEFNYIVYANLSPTLKEGIVTVAPSTINDRIELSITHRVANATDDKKIAGKYADLVITATNNSDYDYYNTFIVVTQYKKNGVAEPIREDYTGKKVTVPAHQTVDIEMQSNELSY
jgi:hypothetical protein